MPAADLSLAKRRPLSRSLLPFSLLALPTAAFCHFVIAGALGGITCLVGSCLWTAAILYIGLFMLTIESATGQTSRLWLCVPLAMAVTSVYIFNQEDKALSSIRIEADRLNYGESSTPRYNPIISSEAISLVTGYISTAPTFYPRTPDMVRDPGGPFVRVGVVSHNRCMGDFAKQIPPPEDVSLLGSHPFMPAEIGRNVRFMNDVCIAHFPVASVQEPIIVDTNIREIKEGWSHCRIYTVIAKYPDRHKVVRSHLIEDRLNIPLFIKDGYVARPTMDGVDRIFGLARREPLLPSADRNPQDGDVFAYLMADIFSFRRRTF